MKKYKDFVPRPDAEYLAWLIAHEKNFDRMADATLQYMKPEERAAYLAEVRDMIRLLKDVAVTKKTLAGLVKEKDLKKRKVTRMIRDIAMCSKKSSSQAPDIIQGLDLICKPVEVDRETVAPSLQAAVYPGRIELSFNKRVLTPVRLYFRRTGGEWEDLGLCIASPYKDTRPLLAPGQPEWREYKALYSTGPETIGQFSDIVKVVFGG